MPASPPCAARAACRDRAQADAPILCVTVLRTILEMRAAATRMLPDLVMLAGGVHAVQST